MWLVLTFVACLATADGPQQCRRVHLPWQGGLLSCLVQGQAAIARWERQHPGFVRTGPFSCGSERESRLRPIVRPAGAG